MVFSNYYLERSGERQRACQKHSIFNLITLQLFRFLKHYLLVSRARSINMAKVMQLLSHLESRNNQHSAMLQIAQTLRGKKTHSMRCAFLLDRSPLFNVFPTSSHASPLPYLSSSKFHSRPLSLALSVAHSRKRKRAGLQVGRRTCWAHDL